VSSFLRLYEDDIYSSHGTLVPKVHRGKCMGCHEFWISDPQGSENTGKAACTLNALLSLLTPAVIDFRRMLQGLYYDTILFRFLLQGA